MKKINKFAIGVGVLATVSVPIIAIKATSDSFSFTSDLNKLKAKLKSTKLKDQLSDSVGSKKVGEEVTPTELGFDAPSLSKDVTANYVVKTPYNITTKMIVVKVTLTEDGGKSVTKDFEVTAKAFNPQNAAIANAKNNGVTDGTLTTLAGRKNDVAYNQVPTNNDVTLPAQDGFKFTFDSATPVADDGSSQVTYTVTNNPAVPGGTPKPLVLPVTGFETKVVADANTKLDGVTDKTLATSGGKKKEIANGATPGAEDVNVPSQDGFTFTYASATPVDENGHSQVTYTVHNDPQVPGEKAKTLVLPVTGFETKVQADAKKATAVADTKLDGVTDKTLATSGGKKKEVANGATPGAEDVNVPTQDGFTFTYASATPVDEHGNSDVTYTVHNDPQVPGEKAKTLVLPVTGFETKVQADAKKATAVADTKLDGVTDKTLATSGGKKKEVANGATPGAEDVNVPTQDGFTFTYASATPVDEHGNSDVTYTVDNDPQVPGEKAKTLVLPVTGFETKLEHANSQTDGVTKDTVTTPLKKVGQKVSYNTKPTESDVNVPTQDGFSFSYKDATLVDKDGTSQVTYNVMTDPKVDGAAPKTITVPVTDFETQLEHANAKINGVKKDTLTTQATKRNEVDNGATPGAEDVNVPSQDGFSFTYVSATPVDKDGITEVVYTVTNNPAVPGETPQYLVLPVTGFKTKTAADVEKKEKEHKALYDRVFRYFEAQKTRDIKVYNKSLTVSDIPKNAPVKFYLGNANFFNIYFPNTKEFLSVTRVFYSHKPMAINEFGPVDTVFTFHDKDGKHASWTKTLALTVNIIRRAATPEEVAAAKAERIAFDKKIAKSEKAIAEAASES